MPTLSVKRELFFQKLGHTMTEEQFDELCFQFGIELDEVTSERQMIAKEQGTDAARGLSDDVIYKIELPANRYDLLTMEGLSRALRCFLGNPIEMQYSLVKNPQVQWKIQVDSSVNSIRPFVVGAILRNITFTPDIYDSFIELQDKLHGGIGRRRTIVSMGTHDLDALHGPIMTYTALAPKDIRFVPLNKSVPVDGNELMRLYEQDMKLKKFLPIIRDFAAFPVILDGQQRVASLPPIINSDFSKISLNTKNIFIEITATDEHKANIALTCLVTSFAEYCQGGIEPVQICYSDRNVITPVLENRTLNVNLDYINGCIGIKVDSEKAKNLLSKMMLSSSIVGEGSLEVTVPPMRSDILHACDIMEDVAIAYGFNNVSKTLPKSFCVAAPLPLNKLTDLIRREIALIGFTEVLSLTLCSREENYSWLRTEDPGNEAVVLENPKTVEYQLVHTRLLPEMLKTLNANKALPLPHKIFQVADVCLLDDNSSGGNRIGSDVGARNERHLSVVYSHHQHSGLEVVHGVLDRLMLMMNVPLNGYEIVPSDLPIYLTGRQAQVYLLNQATSKTTEVIRTLLGSFGILHPECLHNFDVPNVTSSLEINIEPFL